MAGLRERDVETAFNTNLTIRDVYTPQRHISVSIMPSANDQFGEACDVCKKSGAETTVYSCKNCKFYIHPELAKIRRPEKLIHEHPLELFQKIPENEFQCRECGEFCSDEIYGCTSCLYFIHDYCHPVEMAPAERRQAQYMCHPSRPLVGTYVLSSIN